MIGGLGAHRQGYTFPCPWPSQEARLWAVGWGHDSRDPRCPPGRPRGGIRSPSPSTRGWWLAPPSSLGKKNNFKGRRPTDQKEKEEDCSVCLAPLWDNTMLFQTACKHAIHGHCMRGVFQHGITAEQRNMCPTCKGWVWGYWQPPVAEVSCVVDDNVCG